MVSISAGDQIQPPWLQCTHLHAGDPGESECYQQGLATVVRGTPTYYANCPAGYTMARLDTAQPFDSTNTRYKNPVFYAVEASTLACCPSESVFGVSFNYTRRGTRDANPTTTVHDGVSRRVAKSPLPGCYASGLAGSPQEVSGGGNGVLTMGLYADDGGKYDGTTERVWDAATDTLYAHAAEVSYTVFHGTHTCFTNCREYFTYSYSNTQRPASSTSKAEAMPRGDVRAELTVVVVVVVTVVQVALGGLA
jgi:hypothetical protein